MFKYSKLTVKIVFWNLFVWTIGLFIGGFFLAAEETYGAAEAVGSFIGYTSVLVMIAGSCYVALAVANKLLNK